MQERIKYKTVILKKLKSVTVMPKKEKKNRRWMWCPMKSEFWGKQQCTIEKPKKCSETKAEG